MSDALRAEDVAAGTVLITQDDDDFSEMMFYVLEKGSVTVTIKDGANKEVEVGQIGEGGYFGEKALIEKAPRAATVVATVDSKLAVMDVATFERIMVSVRDLVFSVVRRSYNGTGKEPSVLGSHLTTSASTV